MIYDITPVQKYKNYKAQRGPFILIFYKPDEPENKKNYFKLQNISQKYPDIPFLRFDWSDFILNYPNEMQTYEDILIIERLKPTKTENIQNSKQIIKLIKSIRAKRFEYCKNNRYFQFSENRKKMRPWYPYSRLFKAKQYINGFEDNDESEYIFPNSTALSKNEEFLKIINQRNSQNNLKRSQNRYIRRNMKNMTSPKTSLIDKSPYKITDSNKVFIHLTNKKKNIYDESNKTKTELESISKSSEKSSSVIKNVSVSEDLKFKISLNGSISKHLNFSPSKLNNLSYISNSELKSLLDFQNSKPKKYFKIIPNFQKDLATKTVLQLPDLKDVKNKKSLVKEACLPPPYSDHDYICSQNIKNFQNIKNDNNSFDTTFQNDQSSHYCYSRKDSTKNSKNNDLTENSDQQNIIKSSDIVISNLNTNENLSDNSKRKSNIIGFKIYNSEEPLDLTLPKSNINKNSKKI